MKKIKENITYKQYQLLMSSLRGDKSIRELRRQRLLKAFVLLYNLGLRVNELNQFTNSHILELLKNKKLIIKAHKQKTEKFVYITENAKNEILKVFGQVENNDNFVFVSERGNKKTNLTPISMIRDINNYLKFVFGEDTRITSHSFRQTLITNLAINGINTKVIQNIIGHKNINTTYRYIKTTETELFAALETIR